MTDRYILTKTPKRTKIDRKKFNVLIVDDDISSGESLRDLISCRDHTVTYIDEGMKFINRLSEETFDIIFMDYHTDEIDPSDPTINGAYFTKLARECYNFDAPVYAYTGDNSFEAIQDFKDNKFKGVFVKPVDYALINSFFECIETTGDTLNTLNKSLSRLAMKHRNFIYFS